MLLPLRRVRSWFLQSAEGAATRRIRWSRVGATVAVLAITGYLAVAGGAYWFVCHQRGLTRIRFVDLALPWRWSEYRVARGDDLIRIAQQCFAGEQFREALMYAKTGLAQSPRHRDGRLLLAKLLFGCGQAHLGRRTLLEGLAWHAHDPEYWQPLLDRLLLEEADAVVLGLARRHLPADGSRTATARLLALAAATASYFRQDSASVAAYLQRCPGLAESREGRLLRAKNDYDGGYRDLALVHLRQLAADYPADFGIHHELVAALRESGFDDEARRWLIAFELAQPNSAAARLELLTVYYEKQDAKAIDCEVAALQRDFSGNAGVLLSAAGVSAEAGDVAAVRRFTAVLPPRPEASATGELLVIEAMLVARDYHGALSATRALDTAGRTVAAERAAVLASLRTIAYLGLGDVADARAFLGTVLDQPRVRPETLLAVANRLAAIDGGELARLALKRALEIDPRCRAAATRLVELDLLLNCVDDLAIDARRLAAMRRPSLELLRVVQHKLATDLFLFSSENESALAAVQHVLARATSH